MAKSDLSVSVGVKIMGPDEIAALESSRDNWRRLTLETIDLAQRIMANGDSLADKLAQQYLLNEELKRRLEWYRNLLWKRALETTQAQDKRALLKRDSRFNGES